MENPYQPPSSRVADLAPANEALAGRWLRFGAVFLDGLIQGIIFFPLEFAFGIPQKMLEAARTGQTLYGTLFVLSLLGVVAFALVQAYPLVTSGQTWGKKVCSIRIVTLDGRLPSIRQLAIRYAVILLPGRVPFIGALFGLVDVCFIFRDDRRCIHDLAAGTRVVTT